MFCFTQKIQTTRKPFDLWKCDGFEYDDRIGGQDYATCC